jgi:hypothetical protein
VVRDGGGRFLFGLVEEALYVEVVSTVSSKKGERRRERGTRRTCSLAKIGTSPITFLTTFIAALISSPLAAYSPTIHIAPLKTFPLLISAKLQQPSNDARAKVGEFLDDLADEGDHVYGGGVRRGVAEEVHEDVNDGGGDF